MLIEDKERRISLLFSNEIRESPTNRQYDVHFVLWTLLDENPQIAAKGHTERPLFEGAITRIKEQSSYIISGMTYGWNFSYTPSDKLRGVQEYFEMKPIQVLGEDAKNIRYENLFFDDNYVRCTVEFSRSPDMIHALKRWVSVVNPKISSFGEGSASEGFEGFQKAFADAAKNAIRSWAQGKTKNKPKEIEGSLLLRGEPSIKIENGFYKVKLDFFLQASTIDMYTEF